MGVTHYAAMLYPARALGDRQLWPKLKALMLEWMESGENEESLVPQWDASLRFDQRAALPGVKVPVHVIAFAEDVQAPVGTVKNSPASSPAPAAICWRAWATAPGTSRARGDQRGDRKDRARGGLTAA